MNILLIGNAVSMIGCLIMVGIGFFKEKSHILAAQSVQFAFMGVGNLILGAWVGFTANIVSILRNLVFAKFPINTGLKLLFIGLQLALSLGTPVGTLIGWLPILSTAIFTWYLDTGSEVVLKLVIIGTMGMWLVYDLYHYNYVATVFDAAAIISNSIGLWMLRKKA
jgi:hypothetical protein